MTITDGFIVKREELINDEIVEYANCKSVKEIPFERGLGSNKYYLTDNYKVFSVQKLKNSYFVKNIKISDRYQRGCFVRVLLTKGNEQIAYMQNIVYAVNVSGRFDFDKEFDFIDGNSHNYKIENIKPKTYNNGYIQDNVVKFSKAYTDYFLIFTGHAMKICDYISFEDAEDVVSNSFYELCTKIDCEYKKFINVWREYVTNRTIDYMRAKRRYLNVDIGDMIKIGVKSGYVKEVAKPLNLITNDSHKKMIELWMKGYDSVEISKLMGVKDSTIRCNITRIFKKMRDYYKKDIEVYERLL